MARELREPTKREWVFVDLYLDVTDAIIQRKSERAHIYKYYVEREFWEVSTPQETEKFYSTASFLNFVLFNLQETQIITDELVDPTDPQFN